jgi:Do/DeqQ family serine protease
MGGSDRAPLDSMNRIFLAIFTVLVVTSCNRSYSTHAGSEPHPASGSGTAAIASGPLVSYADVVDHVAPAVVTIRSSRRVRAPEQFPFMDDPFFRQFFGGSLPRRGGGNGEVQRSLGSGVIVRADGHIVTNHHVVDGAQDIRVEFDNSKRTYTAKLVGSDAPSDLAVLKIDASGLPVLPLGDSDKVRVGDVCLAVGNPLGVGESVTSGIISAKGRQTDVSTGSFQDFLQTDAAINQGNSGGALVNTRGELIGINSQILSSNGGFIGIGFAIPSNMTKTVMNKLISGGKMERGMLGAGVQTVTNDLAQSFGLKEAKGVAVTSVVPGGPADKAGLKSGDVILKLNGQDVNDANMLRNRVASTQPGSEVALTLWRNGQQQDMRVRLTELTAENARGGQGNSESGSEGASPGKLGITITPLTPDLAARIGVPRTTKGVVVRDVDPSGPAAEAGIQAGDVIQEVNRQPVTSPADMQKALAKPGNPAPLLLINRQGQTVFVPVPQR